MRKETFESVVKNAFLDCQICLMGKDLPYNYGSVRARTKYGETLEIAGVVRSTSDRTESVCKKFYEVNKGTYEDASGQVEEDFINVRLHHNTCGAFILISEIVEISWEVMKAQRKI